MTKLQFPETIKHYYHGTPYHWDIKQPTPYGYEEYELFVLYLSSLIISFVILPHFVLMCEDVQSDHGSHAQVYDSCGPAVQCVSRRCVSLECAELGRIG